MRAQRFALVIGVSATVFAFGVRQARAITLPDSSSCNSGGSCFKITNTNTTGGYAISGVGGEFGVSGSGTATGVLGSSTGGLGVYGSNSSTSYPAVGGNGPYVGVWGVESGTSSNNYGVWGQSNSSGSGSAIYGDAAGSLSSWAGNFNGDVNGRDFYGNSFNPSDARLKKDVANAPYGLKEVMKLRPVTYAWKDPQKHGNGRQVGFIAQEVRSIVPEVVKARTPNADLAMSYTGLVPVLVKAVQEQQAIIEEQGRQIAALQSARRSSLSLRSPDGVGIALAFGLLPVGLFVGRRLRRR